MPKREDYNLREMSENDLELVFEWRNSDRIRANMYTDHLITWDEHRAWFNRVEQDTNSIYFIFEHNKRPIGVVGIVQIDNKYNRCSWAFYLGAEDAPNGSNAIMEFLALEYIFEHLEIRKVMCEVFSFNESVIKLHKKFGFNEEAHFVQHMLKNGKYEDVVALALFADDWKKVKPRLEKVCFRG